MDNKIVIGIVAVIVVVAAAVAVFGFGGNSTDDTVVIYDGNGGTSDSGAPVTSSTNEVMPNLFTNGEYVFDGWNTSKDGTGTSYSAGDTIDASPGNPVTLYAQWAYQFTVETYIGPTTGLQEFDILMVAGPNPEDVHALHLMSMFHIPTSGLAMITIQSAEPLTWTMNEAGNGFVSEYNGHKYTVTFTLSGGATDLSYDVENAPTLSFQIAGNIECDIYIRSVTIPAN